VSTSVSIASEFNYGLLIVLSPIIAAIWFFSGASLLLGVRRVRGFVSRLHRALHLQEPSATDLKISRIVGYMGIIFGFILLIGVLAQSR
jgi:hypothetical protein